MAPAGQPGADVEKEALIRLIRRKAVLVPLLAVALVVVVGLGGGAWFYSGEIKNGALVVDEGEDDTTYDLEVVALGDGRVTLRATSETDDDGDWRAVGTWGLERRMGYDRVGGIIELANDQVVREYTPLGGELTAGDMVRVDSFAFPGDPLEAHGIPFQDVFFTSPLGAFPAWLVNGSSSTWAIFVHGKGASRREALRMLPTAVELGHPSLVITYRNDEDVPRDPTGFYRYGETEWEDLEGAVAYAIDNRADGVVLVGYSMGGAIVMSFLYSSALAGKVRAVVLDSPMLDFGATVDHGAGQRSLPLGLPIPGVLTALAKVISGARFDIDWDGLDYVSRADELSTPILLIHGDADDRVPVATSDSLAEARPDMVQYLRVADADHVRGWNTDPAAYEATVRDFLRGFGQ